MSSRGPTTFYLKRADCCVFLAYVLMLCSVVPFHEPWGDESQAWLLSRDLSIYSLLFQNLRYEGHPALWYLLLWVPSHLHMSFALFNWLAAAIASAGIYVFLRLSPFPFYLRALIPFTFFLGYQYAVVARSYVLFPILGFAVAYLYRERPSRPIAMAVFLGLLANVSIHGTLVALAFAGLFIWKLRDPGNIPERPPQRDCLLGAAIFSMSILFILVCLWPANDMLPVLSPGYMRILRRVAIPARPVEPPPSAMRTIMSANPAPPHLQTLQPPHAPTVPAVVHPSGVPLKGRLAALPRILSYSFTSRWQLAVLYDAVLLIYLFYGKQLKLILPAALLLLFLLFVYNAPWHRGLLWITMLMILWSAWNDSIPPTTLHLQNVTAALLALLCVLQLPWTFRAIRFDIYNPTSGSTAAAAYLHTLPAGLRIAGFGLADEVHPYFPGNIFYNQHPEAFGHFGFDPSLPPLSQVLESHPDVILADESDAPTILAAGYSETHVFCGTLYLPSESPPPFCLYVFATPMLDNRPSLDGISDRR